jgi:hypothetical protein
MNPDLVMLLGTALLSLGTWTYHKIRGDKQSTLSDIASGLVDQGLHLALVKVDSDPGALRDFVSKYVWLELGKAGLENKGIAGALVSGVIEQGIGAALQEARARDHQIDVAMAAAQASIAKTLKMAADDAAELAKQKPVIEYTEITDQAAYDAQVAKNRAEQAASEAKVAAAAAAALAPGPESVK